MDELLNKTTMLHVEEEHEWEDVRADVEMNAELSLVGRWNPKKPCNKKLTTMVLGILWGYVNGWKVRILDQKENSCFVGFSFKDKNICKQILVKAPWLLNKRVLMCWPSG